MTDFAFVGCYTAEMSGNGTGITTFRLEAGDLTEVAAQPMTSPSWLTKHPALPILYATNETTSGEVTSARIDDSGELTVLDVAATGGAHPCHLAITPDARFLLCANYTGGSLAVFSLDAQGRISGRTALAQHEGRGPHENRQEAAHVHMAVPNADGTVVSAVDLGTDEIRSYVLADDGTLSPLAVSKLPPGTGPRQLVRRPGTDLAYVVGELNSTLVTVRETSPGAFGVVSVTASTLDTYDGWNLVAHLELDGDRLYLSNRGHDRVTEFTLDPAKAVVDRPCGAAPRHFALVNGICYVAAQLDDAITAFGIGTAETREPKRYATGTPTFILPVSLP